MAKKTILFLIIILLASSCHPNQDLHPGIPTLGEPLPARLVISEVMTGVEGNNQADFIELYNAGTETANLSGYSLWYQLHESSEEILIHRWNETTLVPPLGHYLLTQHGEVFSVEPDANFKQSLVPSRGGLSLRKGDSVIDQLTWGNGPPQLMENHMAPEMEVGSSLERKPGGRQGNAIDYNDNREDFFVQHSPSPQNTGCALSSDLDGKLMLSISIPELVEPGSQPSLQITAVNQTGFPLEGLQLVLPIPDHFSALEIPENADLKENRILWDFPDLPAGGQFQTSISLQADYTFTTSSLRNSYLTAENWPLPAFAGPLYTEIGGGAIPIAKARELVGREVVIEGTSTMYTGGFYAGSGAKFYLEDDSAGIQVYIAGAGSSLSIPTGVKVRARGRIELYRGATELVPSGVEDIEILQGVGKVEERSTLEVTIQEIVADKETLPGKLVEVTGRVGRVEEFSYSYEVDLIDKHGQLVTLYIDKNTGITVEEIETDQFYRVTGIMEVFDGTLELYPRRQSDLARIFPPGLVIEAHPPTTAKEGASLEVSFTIYNHHPEANHQLIITAPVPNGLTVSNISHNGRQENNKIFWEIPDLAGNGTSTSVEFTANPTISSGHITIAGYTVSSREHPEPVAGYTTYTFLGETVPIWAIQGSGFRSPYLLSRLSTTGIVTGVFPDLEGFWIQEQPSDQDPRTSAGLFINTSDHEIDVSLGELITVTGRIRESYQQTQMVLQSRSDIHILGHSPLPDPVILDPPGDVQGSEVYYESLEGMLTSVPGPAAVVGPTNRYGEFALVLSEHSLKRVLRDSHQGLLIHVDDGSYVTHENRETIAHPVAVGDQVSNIIGPLAFTYGEYKVEPITAIQVQSREVNLPSLDPAGRNEFSLMTWNVENLFDFAAPHPDNPPLPTVSEYKRDLTKTAKTIISAGAPMIVGFQEVENIAILEDLADHALLADHNYQARLIEGNDSRGIDVGYLIQAQEVEIMTLEQYNAPGGITSRPPLLLKLRFLEADAPPLYILNNHFTSMSGGEQATEPRRNAQAGWNTQIVEDILFEDPEALIAVFGDLNSYHESVPLQTLENAGLINVLDVLPAEQRYTYIYQGVSQVLDHILVNQALYDQLVRVDVLHSNADYPPPPAEDHSPLHKSDHDPVIAVFRLP